MNYRKIHNNFINQIKSQNRNPNQKGWHHHHIIPRFLIKEFDLVNSNEIICLTTREHFFIHRLLMKIYPRRPFISSCNVFLYTYKNELKMFGSYLCKRLGKLLGKSMHGKNHHNYGVHWSDETKIKMCIKKLGRNNPQFQVEWSDDRREKLSKSMKKYYARKKMEQLV